MQTSLEHIQLAMHKYIVSQFRLMDLLLEPEVVVRYCADVMAHQIFLGVTVPSMELQTDVLVFECPTSPWQALKKGLSERFPSWAWAGRYRRYQAKLSEYVLYPKHTLDIPKLGQPVIRVAKRVDRFPEVEGVYGRE